MNMPSSKRTSRWERAALWVAGGYLALFLLGGVGFMLVVERRGVGSWRAVVANYTGLAAAVLLFGAVALLLVRAGWLRRTPPHSLLEQGTRFVLAGACGAAGAVLAAVIRDGGPGLTGAATTGAIWGVSGLLTLWLLARVAGKARQAPPAS